MAVDASAKTREGGPSMAKSKGPELRAYCCCPLYENRCIHLAICQNRCRNYHACPERKERELILKKNKKKYQFKKGD